MPQTFFGKLVYRAQTSLVVVVVAVVLAFVGCSLLYGLTLTLIAPPP